MNIYRYCGNNPINFTDPAGLCAEYNADGSIWDDIGHIANGFLEGLSDGSAGVADGLTTVPFTDYSVTRSVREGLNVNNINSQSSYNGGRLGGDVAQSTIITVACTPVSTINKGKQVGGVITGYTKHGLNQAIARNSGRGVSPKAILDAVRNPKKVVEQIGNGTIKYVGKKTTVVVNKQGKVVTTFGKSRGK